VVPVTHGACAALVDDAGPVLPIMDYEFRGVSDIDSDYDASARDFARTASRVSTMAGSSSGSSDNFRGSSAARRLSRTRNTGPRACAASERGSQPHWVAILIFGSRGTEISQPSQER